MQTFYAAFYAAFMFVAGWIAERFEIIKSNVLNKSLKEWI